MKIKEVCSGTIEAKIQGCLCPGKQGEAQKTFLICDQCWIHQSKIDWMGKGDYFVVEEQPMGHLPEEWVQERMEKAKEAYLFGFPLLELSREELIAAVIEGWDTVASNRKSHIREREMWELFGRTGRVW